MSDILAWATSVFLTITVFLLAVWVYILNGCVAEIFKKLDAKDGRGESK